MWIEGAVNEELFELATRRLYETTSEGSDSAVYLDTWFDWAAEVTLDLLYFSYFWS